MYPVIVHKTAGTNLQFLSQERVIDLKISTKGRYALRMMLDLAEHYGDEFISLKEISKRQGISKKYMEQIIPLLNHGHLLRTAKGQHGGYRLARQPSQITAGDVVACAEGGIHIIDCLEDEVNQCPRAQGCMTLPLWQGLNDTINNYLNSYTLQDILDEYNSDVGTYVI